MDKFRKVFDSIESISSVEEFRYLVEHLIEEYQLPGNDGSLQDIIDVLDSIILVNRYNLYND